MPAFLLTVSRGCSQLVEAPVISPVTWSSPQHGSLLLQSEQENIQRNNVQKLAKFDGGKKPHILIYTSEQLNKLQSRI